MSGDFGHSPLLFLIVLLKANMSTPISFIISAVTVDIALNELNVVP